MNRVLASIVAALLGVLAMPMGAQQAPTRPDPYAGRFEALWLMQTLNADLLGSRSATATLEGWCRDHQLADVPRITARLVPGAPTPPTAEQRARLQVSGTGDVKFRRVELRCGTHILSDAENWYVPGRLSAEANRLLDTTDTPFGTAVRSLEPYRQTFDVKVWWSAPALPIPETLFEHRAVLYTREHQPFSEVHEVYHRDVLAFLPLAR